MASDSGPILVNNDSNAESSLNLDLKAAESETNESPLGPQKPKRFRLPSLRKQPDAGLCWRAPACDGTIFVGVSGHGDVVRCRKCRSYKLASQFETRKKDGHLILKPQFLKLTRPYNGANKSHKKKQVQPEMPKMPEIVSKELESTIKDKEKTDPKPEPVTTERSDVLDSLWDRLGLNNFDVGSGSSDNEITSEKPGPSTESNQVSMHETGEKAKKVEKPVSKIKKEKKKKLKIVLPRKIRKHKFKDWGKKAKWLKNQKTRNLGKFAAGKNVKNSPGKEKSSKSKLEKLPGNVRSGIPHFICQPGESLEDYLKRAMEIAIKQKSENSPAIPLVSKYLAGKVYTKEDLHGTPLFISGKRDSGGGHSLKNSLRNLVVNSNFGKKPEKILKLERRNSSVVAEKVKKSEPEIEVQAKVEEKDGLEGKLEDSPSPSPSLARRSSRPPKPAAWKLMQTGWKEGSGRVDGRKAQEGQHAVLQVTTPVEKTLKSEGRQSGGQEMVVTKKDVSPHVSPSVLEWKTSTLDKYREARKHKKLPPIVQKMMQQQSSSLPFCPSKGEGVKGDANGTSAKKTTTLAHSDASGTEERQFDKKMTLPSPSLPDIVSIGTMSPISETSTKMSNKTSHPVDKSGYPVPLNDALKALPTAFGRFYGAFWSKMYPGKTTPDGLKDIFRKAQTDAEATVRISNLGLREKRKKRECDCCVDGRDTHEHHCHAEGSAKKKKRDPNQCRGCGAILTDENRASSAPIDQSSSKQSNQLIDQSSSVLTHGERAKCKQICLACTKPFEQYIEEPWKVTTIKCHKKHTIEEKCEACWFWRCINVIKKFIKTGETLKEETSNDDTEMADAEKNRALSCYSGPRVRYVYRSHCNSRKNAGLFLSALPINHKKELYAEARESYEDETPTFSRNQKTKSKAKDNKMNHQKRAKVSHKRMKSPASACPTPVYTNLFSSTPTHSIMNPCDDQPSTSRGPGQVDKARVAFFSRSFEPDLEDDNPMDVGNSVESGNNFNSSFQNSSKRRKANNPCKVDQNERVKSPVVILDRLNSEETRNLKLDGSLCQTVSLSQAKAACLALGEEEEKDAASSSQNGGGQEPSPNLETQLAECAVKDFGSPGPSCDGTLMSPEVMVIERSPQANIFETIKLCVPNETTIICNGIQKEVSNELLVID